MKAFAISILWHTYIGLIILCSLYHSVVNIYRITCYAGKGMAKDCEMGEGLIRFAVVQKVLHVIMGFLIGCFADHLMGNLAGNLVGNLECHLAGHGILSITFPLYVHMSLISPYVILYINNISIPCL